MALKTVKRITFSFPISTIMKLEMNVPKNKRSKAVAQLIEEKYGKRKEKTYEEVAAFWDEIARNFKGKTKKTAVQLIREDRLSH